MKQETQKTKKAPMKSIQKDEQHMPHNQMQNTRPGRHGIGPDHRIHGRHGQGR